MIPRSALGTEELFTELEAELSRFTPLKDELRTCLADAKDALAHGNAEEGLVVYNDLLTWLKERRPPATGTRVPGSLGPLAVAALRQPETGKEVIILGSSHNVPGLAKSDNPMPSAVRRAISFLQPDLVAIESDEMRGKEELEKVARGVSGKVSFLLPDMELPMPDLSKLGLFVDTTLLDKIKGKLGPKEMNVENYVRALRELYAESTDQTLACNVFALHEYRCALNDDWGRDVTAALESAGRAEKPVLLCDLPQQWTLSTVLPVYSESWVKARPMRLRYMEDVMRVARTLEAEEKIDRDRVIRGAGGDLPTLDYALSVLRPAIGAAEAKTRSLWLNYRDPVMAKAVVDAMEGRARKPGGSPATLKPCRRAVLQVGSNHVEGIAKELQQKHNFKVVAEPIGGWKAKVAPVTGANPPRTRGKGFADTASVRGPASRRSR